MHSQAVCDLLLTVPPIPNCIRYLLVSPFLVSFHPSRKQLIEIRPVQVPLGPRYLLKLFCPLRVRLQFLEKTIFSQNTLRFDLSPDRSSSDTGPNKIPVGLLRKPSGFPKLA